MNDLSQYLYFIEQSHLNQSAGRIEASKKDAIAAIKILNTLAKTLAKEDKCYNIVQQLSRYTLAYYDQIDKDGLSLSTKMEWLGSKSYMPLISFSSSLNSADSKFIAINEMYIDPDSNLEQVPDRLSVGFKNVTIQPFGSTSHDLTDLYQDLLANCSFVSSVLSIVDSQAKTSLKLQDLISPHGPSNKYKIVFNFNGARRVVCVDSRLPFPNVDRSLFLSSFSDHSLYWPAMVEKAFLKVMGEGYAFSGSNMAMDTYLLSGWIPEIIRIRNNMLPPQFETLWKLLQEGEVLLGVGTGKLSNELAKQLNLISHHDYTMVSMNSDGSIVLKNPWIERENINTRFITIDEFTHVKSLYVNWKNNFRMCSKVTFIHRGSSKYFFENPQYSITNKSDEIQDVWLLLERHLSGEDISIRLGVYKSENGDRVLIPNQFEFINASDRDTNNRLYLVKLKIEPRKSYTAVVTSSSGCTFTLSCLSNINTDIVKARFANPNSLPVQEDEWDITNSGGNWSFSSFINNPQYSIEITAESNLQLALFSNSPKTVVNFHLFHSEKGSINIPLRTFDKKKLLLHENYNEGYQIYHFRNLQPGYYKLVLSTFDVGVRDGYQLLANFSEVSSVKISKIWNHLGLFTEKRQIEWSNSNRFKLHFSVDNFKSKMTFHIQHRNGANEYESSSSYRPGIRASIFHARTQAPIQINENWSESLYGVFVDCFLEWPGEFILLVERFEQGPGRCTVEIGSSTKFSLTT
ncbi:predicted protein [Scheffersomyces stipitis CBS 6054]|uniref:Cysteine protease RIM13 n=1 Tax=Scheffersomyces stipitis (strain ATCC 58785 / CBS 6054 / NBRC 10063 / NRRL Y-11545) TaxID=322104 RepID=A3LNN9_PICST|nr:predicted protein [Scheffersomyces stipitis CBS 6054]ABN64360.2 predicted protein [Scheffersomyces stipitis CBS 6054]KAG2736133.1 hypothetical protein G9P44_000223 [Scheffersomyces stipitis]